MKLPCQCVLTLFIIIFFMLSISAFAVDEYPVLLPILTNDFLGIGAKRLLTNIDDEYQLNQSARHAPPVSVDVYLICEDIYTADGVNEKANVNGHGSGSRITWHGKTSGYGYFDTRREDIDGDYQTVSDRTNINFDFTKQSGYLKIPITKSISIGGCVSSQSYDGQGQITTLSGVPGESKYPLYSVQSDQQSWLLFISGESQKGGVLVGTGRENMRNTFTRVGTDRLTLPIDRDGDSNAIMGWLNTKGGRLSIAYSSSNQQGNSPVFYNYTQSGEAKTVFDGSQLCLQYSKNRGVIWTGKNETNMGIDAYGVRPNSNSLTVIAKGSVIENSIYGGGRYDLLNGKATNIGLSYTLHRIDIQGDGIYRSGYLGGLIEFERFSGAFDDRYWVNVLSLDVSQKFGRLKLGYCGTLSVPIKGKDKDASLPPVPDKSKASERGGLTHVISLGYSF